VFDAGYDPVALTVDLAELRAAVLVGIRSDRVFYADPPQRPPGTTGRPRKHRQRLACQDPATWPAPVAALATTDDQYGQVVVQAWSGLHPKLGRRGRWAAAVVPPVVRGTVIGVQVSRLPKPSGPVKVLWLWWAGPGRPDLDVVWRA
jgi:DDE superfamily endonuclease